MSPWTTESKIYGRKKRVKKDKNTDNTDIKSSVVKQHKDAEERHYTQAEVKYIGAKSKQ